MKILYTVASLLFAINANAAFIKVAVLDTGIDKRVVEQGLLPLCNVGPQNVSNSFTPYDSIGHGTLVSGLINEYAKDAKYCQIPIKWEGDSGITMAINHILKYFPDVDIVNISAGGEEYSKKECRAIKKLINEGITVVAAAGNDNHSLDNVPYFPAMCDEEVIVVGNGKNENYRQTNSNWGSAIDVWIDGDKKSFFGIMRSGTSMSAAIETGKLIKEMYDTRIQLINLNDDMSDPNIPKTNKKEKKIYIRVSQSRT